MRNYKLNKPLAGYHILMILSAVDFKFLPEEDLVIRKFLAQEFPFQINLDDQMEEISRLYPTEWEQHFRKVLEDFYDESTEDERKNFIQFAIELVKADAVVTKEENQYMRILFKEWGISRN